MTSKRILITGATGGLGLTLVKTFSDNGYHVTATGRSNHHIDRLKSYRCHFIQADLTDITSLNNLCKNQQIIIHAAALSSSFGHPKHFESINVNATQNLLEAAKNNGCKDFIFISSPSIYTDMKDQFLLTEKILPPKKSLNHYSRTKKQAENLVIAANDISFRTTAIRPRAIVTPDDKVLLPKLIEMIRLKKVPLLRNGNAIVELTDVRDVANAVLLATQKMQNIHGHIFNISGGKGISVKNLAHSLAQALDQKIDFIKLPLSLAKIIAYISEYKSALTHYKKEPILSKYTLATLSYSQTFDLTLAKEMLHFEPSYDAVSSLLQIAKSFEI